ncbi:hypothetical protein, partial [Streptococcus iniae]|uniref:hypothetical protein n=1 Tax=Streptococcus iniae TaxID=1346 RepID=UPI0004CE00A1
MPKEKLYSVEKICRINIRYYLIRVDRKYYIIDYSDPKNFKNYFLAYFPEVSNAWDIYDVTVDKDKFKKQSLDIKKIEKIFVCLLLGYLFNMVLFPQQFNLSQLTYNDIIVDKALVWLGLGLVISLMISIVLMLKTKELDLSSYSHYQLTTSRLKKSNIFKGLISSLFLYSSFWVLAFLGSSYLNLIIYGL